MCKTLFWSNFCHSFWRFTTNEGFAKGNYSRKNSISLMGEEIEYNAYFYASRGEISGFNWVNGLGELRAVRFQYNLFYSDMSSTTQKKENLSTSYCMTRSGGTYIINYFLRRTWFIFPLSIWDDLCAEIRFSPFLFLWQSLVSVLQKRNSEEEVKLFAQGRIKNW